MRNEKMTSGGGSNASKELARPIPGLFATGRDGPDGSFSVVTVQRGQPPEVNAEGSRLDAKVKVEKHVIAFDGRNIVLGE